MLIALEKSTTTAMLRRLRHHDRGIASERVELLLHGGAGIAARAGGKPQQDARHLAVLVGQVGGRDLALDPRTLAAVVGMEDPA